MSRHDTRPSSGLTREDLLPPIDYERREVRQMKGSDFNTWLTIINIFITVGAFFFFGGKLDQRVTTLEQKEIQHDIKDNGTSIAVSALTVDTAVIKDQVGRINSWVDRQDRK